MSDAFVRDRDGEFRPVHDPNALPACICDGSGWAGDDHWGRPRVCLHCRPHLIGRIGERPWQRNARKARLHVVR